MLDVTIMDDVEIVVCKHSTKTNKFYLEGIEDEELSRRQLAALLGVLGIHLVEVAFMITEFQRHPDHTKAHFGIGGTFIFTK